MTPARPPLQAYSVVPRGPLPPLLVTATLVLLGYYVVYLITPWNLADQIHQSADRFIFHIWPALVFAFFLYAESPTASDVAGPS